MALSLRKAGASILFLGVIVASSVDCSIVASPNLGVGVGGLCTSPADCHSGSCESGLCTQDCTEDTQCPAPTLCVNKLCRAGCHDDAACPQASICESSVCVPGCRDNTKCSSDKVCAAKVDPTCTVEAPCTLECRDALAATAIFSGTVDGQDTWTTSHKQGLDAAAQRLGYVRNGADTYSRAESILKADDFAKQVQTAAANGTKVIVTNNRSLTDEVVRQASAYPDVKFIVAGGVKTSGATNVGAYGARTEALSFAAGKLAARIASVSPSTHKCIGMVLPTPTKETIRDTNGFVQGVRSYDKNVKVIIRWLGAGRDQADAPSYDYAPTNYTVDLGKLYREELLTAQLADLGCRVIAQRTDTSRVVGAVEKRLKLAVKNGVYKHDIFSMGYNIREACRSNNASDGDWYPSCMSTSFFDWTGTYAKAFDQIYRGVWTGAPVSEDLRVDTDALLKFEVSPFPNVTGIGADEAKKAIETAADAGIDKIFTGPINFTGQRDAGGDGTADPVQTLNTGAVVPASEQQRMCWFVEGTYELPDATVALNESAYTGLIPAMVPGGPSLSGQVTSIDDANPASVKKYGDVSQYLKKIGRDSALDMNCQLQ